MGSFRVLTQSNTSFSGRPRCNVGGKRGMDRSAGRQRLAIGLGDVLSQDSAIWTAGKYRLTCMDYRIGLTTIFAPIDVQLLRASEFEARAAARFEQTCGDRLGRPFRTPAGPGVNPATLMGIYPRRWRSRSSTRSFPV